VCVACGGASQPPVRNAAPGHDPEMAVASGAEVRVYQITPKGPVLERTVKTPSSVGSMEWVGDTPTVMMLVPSWGDDMDKYDPKYDGQVGRIGKTYEPFAALPAETWASGKPEQDGDLYTHEIDRAGWQLIVTASGEVWQGRSEWWFVPDAGGWGNWVYARRAPGPVVTSKEQPKEVTGFAMPKVAPAPGVTAEIIPGPPKTDEGTIVPDQLLQCTTKGETVVLPPEGDPRVELFTVDNLTWLATDPPLFRVEEVRQGYTAIVQPVVYEGCTPTATYGGVTAGPDGISTLGNGADMLVLQNGRVIGKVPNGTVVFRQ